MLSGPHQKSVGGTIVTHAVSKTVAPKSTQKADLEKIFIAQRESEVSQVLALRQKQSLELVQIMLNASIGSLFYLRGFLPSTCFETRYLETKSDLPIAYGDFIGPEPKAKVQKGSQPLRVLLRNRDAIANTVLDLLEGGVFDALRKHVVEAIQLTISRDKEKPLHVLESYTFTFAYKFEGLEKALTSVSFSNGNCSMEMGTFRSAKVGLEMIIRRLITLSTILPSLPSKRFLHVHLFYNENCQPEYEPPGFESTEFECISYPQIENWTKETQSCGSMDGPYHRVGLRVTSLRWSGTGDNEIPENVEYSDQVFRDWDIGIDNNTESADKLDRHSKCDFQGLMLPTLSLHVPAAPNNDTGNLDVPASPCEFSQALKDEADKMALEKMLEPSSIDSGMAPTQKVFDLNLNDSALAVKPQLSQLKATKIRKERNLSPIERIVVDNNSLTSTIGVDCQCGWGGEEEQMISCYFCEASQHLGCYGFSNNQDIRIPDKHACYKCLLLPDEKEILDELNSLVLLRRAMHIILNEGYQNSTKAFAEKLHCNGQTIVQITDLLKKRGFLKATPGSKRKGFAGRGLPSFVIPETQVVRELIYKEILDPFAKISHHYTIPRVAWAPLDRGLNEYNTIHAEFGSFRDLRRCHLWPLDEKLNFTSEDSPLSIAASVDPGCPKVNSRQCVPLVGFKLRSQGKKRKLSNAAQALDIGERADLVEDDSS
ncbi:hypothetical protein LOY94_004878 [Ophidiomyces ophidiicola]|nr:hypothetical protein LOZ62_004891 [Ophidiomyces ophidiicola]KAI2048111.1 hypothetical protein LOZ38_004491 [Ophidiomyces ophidiicola]KAI2055893.1 hypothetical protein LOZ43_003619 [Ophidiomyces ophidiicola]KAI2080783.1 hypothetical protein LOZ37_001409 [Ophidiomyces ophidiicola]KAI2085627.1 hypothetical protein LOZ36_003861 [Ophidiomyces ophidiicola]